MSLRYLGLLSGVFGLILLVGPFQCDSTAFVPPTSTASPKQVFAMYEKLWRTHAQVAANKLAAGELKTEQDWLDEDQDLQNQYTGALKAIQSLKPIYRDIVIDRLLNNMKYEDIADKYDLPLQTIKNRILRGKRIITEELEK